MEIKYIPRYSYTDLPDEQGRWARKCMYKDLHLAWINRLEVKNTVKFLVTTYFPCGSQDIPTKNKVADSFDDAMTFIETEWEKFLKIVREDSETEE
jgi:hypothetical protein